MWLLVPVDMWVGEWLRVGAGREEKGRVLDFSYDSQDDMEEMVEKDGISRAEDKAQKIKELKEMKETAQKLKRLQTRGWKVDAMVLKKSQLPRG